MMHAYDFLPRMKTAAAGVAPTSSASSSSGGASGSPTGAGSFSKGVQPIKPITPPAEQATTAPTSGMTQPLNVSASAGMAGGRGLNAPLKGGVLPSSPGASEAGSGAKVASGFAADLFVEAVGGAPPKTSQGAQEKKWYQRDQDGANWGEDTSFTGGDATAMPAGSGGDPIKMAGVVSTGLNLGRKALLKTVPRLAGKMGIKATAKGVGAAGEAAGEAAQKAGLFTRLGEGFGILGTGSDAANMASGAQLANAQQVKSFQDATGIMKQQKKQVRTY